MPCCRRLTLREMAPGMRGRWADRLGFRDGFPTRRQANPDRAPKSRTRSSPGRLQTRAGTLASRQSSPETPGTPRQMQRILWTRPLICTTGCACPTRRECSPLPRHSRSRSELELELFGRRAWFAAGRRELLTQAVLDFPDEARYVSLLGGAEERALPSRGDVECALGPGHAHVE